MIARIERGIDALCRGIGRAACWLALVMVAVGAYNAVARYLGRWVGASYGSNAYIELQWYLFSALFLLTGAYTLQRDGHVRVDVLYGRLGARARACIEVLGILLALLPFCAFVVVVSWPAVRSSWHVAERSPDPGGLARYPLKTLIPSAFALLMLQGVAGLIRALRDLRRGGRR